MIKVTTLLVNNIFDPNPEHDFENIPSDNSFFHQVELNNREVHNFDVKESARYLEEDILISPKFNGAANDTQKFGYIPRIQSSKTKSSSLF